MLDMLITGRDVYDGTEGSIPLALSASIRIETVLLCACRGHRRRGLPRWGGASAHLLGFGDTKPGVDV